jgi:hypothetical protein
MPVLGASTELLHSTERVGVAVILSMHILEILNLKLVQGTVCSD